MLILGSPFALKAASILRVCKDVGKILVNFQHDYIMTFQRNFQVHVHAVNLPFHLMLKVFYEIQIR